MKTLDKIRFELAKREFEHKHKELLLNVPRRILWAKKERHI